MNNENIFEPILRNLTDKAERACPLNPEDYQGEDGLLYCGKCHTPKQVVFLGEVKPCLCHCANEKFERGREENKRRNRADDALSNAFDNPSLRDWTFKNDDGATPLYTNAARQYCEHFDEFYAEGKGLLLWNPQSGSGKS